MFDFSGLQWLTDDEHNYTFAKKKMEHQNASHPSRLSLANCQGTMPARMATSLLLDIFADFGWLDIWEILEMDIWVVIFKTGSFQINSDTI